MLLLLNCYVNVLKHFVCLEYFYCEMFVAVEMLILMKNWKCLHHVKMEL